MGNNKVSAFHLVLFFVALFPITPTYFDVFSIAISNILCVLLVVGYYAVSGKMGLKHKISKLELLILVWVMWKSIICVIHGSFTDGLWLFMFIIAGAVVTSSITSFEKFYRVIDVLITMAAVISVFGIFESFTQFNVFSLLNTSGATLNYNQLRFGLMRILSFSSHTIQYCSYCMLILSLLFYRIANAEIGKKRTRYILIYCLVFTNAILTLSRSLILCIFLCQLLLLSIGGYRYFIRTVLKTAVVIGVAGFLLSVFISPVANAIHSVAYMILAVFNDNYATMITSSFGNDNISGFGDRINLYKWVTESLQGNYLLGMGPRTPFKYAYNATNGLYNWTNVKTSIEVNYLNILYRYGILTLILEVMSFAGIVIKSMKMHVRYTIEERKISFTKVCGITTLCYLLSFFAVSQGTEFKTYIIFIALFLAYIRISRNIKTW